ncbi:MAG TPA: hypothetical protein DD666_15410 [Advenella kashmirensis]|uniref:ATPase AAA-type core domain-containing protein n=1 Tax=Advenella kashmirensis TaxID=310575 RepID=A0A356LJV2_9BURK|nr:hypothetical protein [Advenella kashmirensis]
MYIFDEPESALSPQRQLAALARMHELVQGGSQFLIATHSPILMAYPDADIYQFDKSGISTIAYEDTDHFNITRNFLANPGRMLDILMSEYSRRAHVPRSRHKSRRHSGPAVPAFILTAVRRAL